MDLNGDGDDEEIFADKDGLRFGGNMEPIEGEIKIGVRGDYTQDGKEDAILGLGSSKKYRDAPMRLLLVTESIVQTLWEQKSTQNMITDLHYVNGDIFFVHSADDGALHSAWIRKGEYSEIDSHRLALRQIPLKNDDVIVGRVYGRSML